jgi:thiol-disulfide isomerase/thioredoxin
VLAVATSRVWAIELGDPAPGLKVKKWIKGKPVDLKGGKGKNVFVIEFWATGCQPCQISIPHMTELQKQYKDKGVIVIGLTSADPRQRLSDVRKFVREMGERMDYAVAYDEGHKTSEAYLGAFGVLGIPYTFVIDKEGRIAWHGNPVTGGLDAALKEVVAGTYDIEAQRLLARNRSKAIPLVQRYMRLAMIGGEGKGAKELAREIMPLIENDATLLDGLSWQITTNPVLQYRDLELAMWAARRANELTSGSDPMIIDTYARAFWATGQKQQAIEHQKKAVELAKDERMKADLERTLKEYERSPGG